MIIQSFSSKHLKISLILVVPLLAVSSVNYRITNAQTLIDTSAATSIGSSIEGGSAINPTSIREKIRSDIEARAKNIKTNQETRNILVEKRQMTASNGTSTGSTTPERRKIETKIETKNIRVEARGPMDRLGTSTASTTKRISRDGYENNGKSMILNFFKQRKDEISKQFTVALRNLTNLQTRISSRIDKEKLNGRDMTEASRLLIVAKTKISIANDAVNALRSYSPNASVASTTASTTQSINLDITRKMIVDVQKAIKDAQKSLNDVVIAIAHAMGVKIGNDGKILTTPVATSTSSVTPTPTVTTSPSVTITPTPTATTTASTTNN
jgi:hypothetical protein